MGFIFISAGSFVAVSTCVEHIAFGIFKGIPVISETGPDREIVAPVVDLPVVVTYDLGQTLFVGITVVAGIYGVIENDVRLLSEFVIRQVASIGFLGHSCLGFEKQTMVFQIEFVT
jgi:hypothetical protein